MKNYRFFSVATFDVEVFGRVPVFRISPSVELFRYLHASSSASGPSVELPLGFIRRLKMDAELGSTMHAQAADMNTTDTHVEFTAHKVRGGAMQLRDARHYKCKLQKVVFGAIIIIIIVILLYREFIAPE